MSQLSDALLPTGLAPRQYVTISSQYAPPEGSEAASPPVSPMTPVSPAGSSEPSSMPPPPPTSGGFAHYAPPSMPYSTPSWPPPLPAIEQITNLQQLAMPPYAYPFQSSQKPYSYSSFGARIMSEADGDATQTINNRAPSRGKRSAMNLPPKLETNKPARARSASGPRYSPVGTTVRRRSNGQMGEPYLPRGPVTQEEARNACIPEPRSRPPPLPSSAMSPPISAASDLSNIGFVSPMHIMQSTSMEDALKASEVLIAFLRERQTIEQAGGNAITLATSEATGAVTQLRGRLSAALQIEGLKLARETPKPSPALSHASLSPSHTPTTPTF